MRDSDDARARRIDPDELAARLRAADFPVPGNMFCDERGLEWLIAVPQRTLRDWRRNGVGPPALKTARWLYPLEDLAAWLDSRSADQLTGNDGDS